MMQRQQTLVIETPEGIRFPLLLAQPAIRGIAWLVDFVITLVVASFAVKVVQAPGMLGGDLKNAAASVTAFLVVTGFPMLMEWFCQGRSPGKWLFRLRVMDIRGLRLRFSQVFIRNILRPIDQVPFFYLVGGLVSFFNPRNQRIGDIAANTIVVYHPCVDLPDLERTLETPFNSLRNHPHLTARLRQFVPVAVAELAFQALTRRDRMDDDARIKLFHTFRQYFETIVSFPDETTHGLSDEQYVRNCADILFRR